MNASQANDALEGRILTALESSRQKQRISVAELARRIGVGKKRLWYALNGQRAMRADEFVKLCASWDPPGLSCHAACSLMLIVTEGEEIFSSSLVSSSPMGSFVTITGIIS